MLVEDAAEVHPEGIEEGRPSVRLARAKPRHQPGEVALRVGRDPHLGVEVDDRDVLGPRQPVEEPDGGGPRHVHVHVHRSAGVEEQPEAKRGRLIAERFEAADEEPDLLPAAGFEDLEVARLEMLDRGALPIDDRDAEVDELDTALEGGLCARRRDAAGRERDDERGDRQRREARAADADAIDHGRTRWHVPEGYTGSGDSRPSYNCAVGGSSKAGAVSSPSPYEVSCGLPGRAPDSHAPSGARSRLRRRIPGREPVPCPAAPRSRAARDLRRSPAV